MDATTPIKNVVQVCKEIVAQDRSGGVTMGLLFDLEGALKTIRGGRGTESKAQIAADRQDADMEPEG